MPAISNALAGPSHANLPVGPVLEWAERSDLFMWGYYKAEVEEMELKFGGFQST